MLQSLNGKLAMAKLYFYYATMNAGKSTMLLQTAYNYQERGMEVLLFKPFIDKRSDANSISSRIGLKAQAISFDGKFNFTDFVKNQSSVNCILIDEAQFLSKQHVLQLAEIVDRFGIPVLAFGLRSDFQAEVFEGSRYLLAWADELIEVKAVCFCGKKATMTARLDDSGKRILQGEQILIGGNERYIALCRRHFFNFSDDR